MSTEKDPSVTGVVAFDESGNTGEDLLNEQQPVYVLASVRLSDIEIRSIVPPDDSEHHFARDRRSAAGRAKIISLLTSPLLRSDSVKVSIMHKRFFITGKIVDLLIEPAMRATGFDLYRDGLHRAAANLLHAVWPAFAPEVFLALQEAFVDLCRARTLESLDRFYDVLQELQGRTEGQPDWAFEALRLSRDIGGAEILEQTRSVIPSHLDPAATALTALLQKWAADMDRIEIHHDESNEIRRQQPLLESFWNDEAPTAEFSLWNGSVLRYPAPIEDLQFVTSHGSPPVQLADVVAGAVATIGRALVGAPHDERFVAALRETPVMNWIVGASIWPTLAVTPEEVGAQHSGDPWLADNVARWLAVSEGANESREP